MWTDRLEAVHLTIRRRTARRPLDALSLLGDRMPPRWIANRLWPPSIEATLPAAGWRSRCRPLASVRPRRTIPLSPPSWAGAAREPGASAAPRPVARLVPRLPPSTPATPGWSRPAARSAACPDRRPGSRSEAEMSGPRLAGQRRRRWQQPALPSLDPPVSRCQKRRPRDRRSGWDRPVSGRDSSACRDRRPGRRSEPEKAGGTLAGRRRRRWQRPVQQPALPSLDPPVSRCQKRRNRDPRSGWDRPPPGRDSSHTSNEVSMPPPST